MELSKVETPKKLDVKDEDDMEKALKLSMMETPKELMEDADDKLENPVLISRMKTPKKEIEDSDAELNLAIEPSKQDKTTEADNTGEEAELKLALYLSKMETPEKHSPLIDVSDNELILALELSKWEAVKVKARTVHEMDVSCSRHKGISASSSSQQTCTRGEKSPIKNRKRKLSERSKNVDEIQDTVEKSGIYTFTVQVDLNAQTSNGTGVKSRILEGNDGEDELKEKASEILGEDYLPVIKRPRMATYRQHMNTEDRQSVKNEDQVDIKIRHNTGKTDAEIAQMLQEELDNHNTGKTDAEIAQMLQEELDNEAKMKEPTKNIDDVIELIARYQDTQRNQPPSINVETIDLTAENVTMNDEELARQLDAELNKKPVEIKIIYPAENEVSALANDVNIVKTSGAKNRREDVRRGNNDGADLVRELQRKELEKIERWRKRVEADGILAQRVESLPDDTSSSTDMSQRGATYTETSFKKMVSQHGVSREKAVPQLNENRRLEALRYQTGGLERRGGGNIQSQPLATVTGHVTHVNLSQPYLGGNGTLVNQSQTAARNHVTQTNQSDAVQVIHLGTGGIDSGEIKQYVSQSNTDDSAMKLLSQSGRSDDGKLNQNVKCGNCQQIGHARIYSMCPRYHTAEETARRQAKLEKKKQQKEEKQKQEAETLEILTDHQRVHEEMMTQIQTEMSTILTTLQQRAKDLEKQVNSRVKKMEKSKKKK